MVKRPPVPSDLRRRVLVEAGHRCAIPTCRHIEVDVHHIVPWAQCQAHKYDNLIAICPNCHRRADRGEIDRKSLRLYKLNLRFIHDKYSQFEMDMMFELHALQSEQVIMWPPYLNLLIKRLIESQFVDIERPRAKVSLGGMQASPDHLKITPRGRQFIDSLGLKEL